MMITECVKKRKIKIACWKRCC